MIGNLRFEDLPSALLATQDRHDEVETMCDPCPVEKKQAAKVFCVSCEKTFCDQHERVRQIHPDSFMRRFTVYNKFIHACNSTI